MNNLSEFKTGLTPRCDSSEMGERSASKPHSNSKSLQRQYLSSKEGAQIKWMLADGDGFQAAMRRKHSLGSLPRRAAKYACADFDLEDETQYSGEDGMSAAGGKLAGVTAYIVRCAKDPIDYLFSLRDIPAKVIEPIKTYLRVKLAMGRLETEIARARAAEKENIKPVIPQPRPCPGEVPDIAARFRDDSAGEFKSASPPIPHRKFTWHTSPAKTYGFKEMTAAYGYDPRATSVYWIEKRANALRRRWKDHGKLLRGDTATPKRRPTSQVATSLDESAAPKIKYFTPADADYNSVWPPIKLPEGPPKLKVESAVQSIELSCVDAEPSDKTQKRTADVCERSIDADNQTASAIDCGAARRVQPGVTLPDACFQAKTPTKTQPKTRIYSRSGHRRKAT